MSPARANAALAGALQPRVPQSVCGQQCAPPFASRLKPSAHPRALHCACFCGRGTAISAAPAQGMAPPLRGFAQPAKTAHCYSQHAGVFVLRTSRTQTNPCAAVARDPRPDNVRTAQARGFSMAFPRRSARSVRRSRPGSLSVSHLQKWKSNPKPKTLARLTPRKPYSHMQSQQPDPHRSALRADHTERRARKHRGKRWPNHINDSHLERVASSIRAAFWLRHRSSGGQIREYSAKLRNRSLETRLVWMIDITAAVSELDQAAQAIVRLWIIEGLDVRIVSERLRISESTLYRRRLEILQALDQHPAFDTSWS
jgi:hypothetical protein